MFNPIHTFEKVRSDSLRDDAPVHEGYRATLGSSSFIDPYRPLTSAQLVDEASKRNFEDWLEFIRSFEHDVLDRLVSGASDEKHASVKSEQFVVYRDTIFVALQKCNSDFASYHKIRDFLEEPVRKRYIAMLAMHNTGDEWLSMVFYQSCTIYLLMVMLMVEPLVSIEPPCIETKKRVINGYEYLLRERLVYMFRCEQFGIIALLRHVCTNPKFPRYRCIDILSGVLDAWIECAEGYDPEDGNAWLCNFPVPTIELAAWCCVSSHDVTALPQRKHALALQALIARFSTLTPQTCVSMRHDGLHVPVHRQQYDTCGQAQVLKQDATNPLENEWFAPVVYHSSTFHDENKENPDMTAQHWAQGLLEMKNFDWQCLLYGSPIHRRLDFLRTEPSPVLRALVVAHMEHLNIVAVPAVEKSNARFSYDMQESQLLSQRDLEQVLHEFVFDQRFARYELNKLDVQTELVRGQDLERFLSHLSETAPQFRSLLAITNDYQTFLYTDRHRIILGVAYVTNAEGRMPVALTITMVGKRASAVLFRYWCLDETVVGFLVQLVRKTLDRVGHRTLFVSGVQYKKEMETVRKDYEQGDSFVYTDQLAEDCPVMRGFFLHPEDPVQRVWMLSEGRRRDVPSVVYIDDSVLHAAPLLSLSPSANTQQFSIILE